MQPDNMVIVGAAAVSPYGIETTDFIQGIDQGPVIFEPSDELAKYLHPSSLLAASVPEYSARKVLNARGIGHFEGITQHLCVAAQSLQTQLGFDDAQSRSKLIDDEKLSLLIGTTGPVQSVLNFDCDAREEPEYVVVGQFPNVVYNVPACYASIRHAAKASVISLNDGDTSSANAIKLAAQKLKQHRADMVWMGGVEALTPAHVLMTAMNYQHDALPNYSEGAYLMAGVRQATAKQQGLPVYAELEAACNVYCPDPLHAEKEIFNRLEQQVPESLNDLSWLLTRHASLSRQFSSRVRILNIEQQLGYLAAAGAAASLIYMLANTQVKTADRFLLIDHDANGASCALLLRKLAQFS